MIKEMPLLVQLKKISILVKFTKKMHIMVNQVFAHIDRNQTRSRYHVSMLLNLEFIFITEMELPPDHRYSESDDSSSSLACDHHRGVPYSSEAYSSMRRRHPSHGRPSDYGSLANNRVRRSSRLTCQPTTPSLDREKPVREGLWPDINRIQAGRAGSRKSGLFSKWQGLVSFDIN